MVPRLTIRIALSISDLTRSVYVLFRKIPGQRNRYVFYLLIGLLLQGLIFHPLLGFLFQCFLSQYLGDPFSLLRCKHLVFDCDNHTAVFTGAACGLMCALHLVGKIFSPKGTFFVRRSINLGHSVTTGMSSVSA